MELEDGKISLNAGMIRAAEYSYLIDSKTLLIVQEPAKTEDRSLPIFFTGLFLFVSIATFFDGQHIAWIWVSLFLFAVSAYNLIKSFLPKSKAKEWTLMVGSYENPINLFSSTNQAEFEAKRTEIEQALMARES